MEFRGMNRRATADIHGYKIYYRAEGGGMLAIRPTNDVCAGSVRMTSEQARDFASALVRAAAHVEGVKS